MSIEDELRKMDQIVRMLRQSGSLEGIVLEHGRRFTPAPLPEDMMPGEPKNCFSNAMAVVLGAPDEENYRYCEGYAWREGHSLILIHHAWVAVEGTDVAFDPTLPGAVHYEYWGIEFDTDTAVEVMNETGVTGLNLEHFARQKLLEAEQ